MSRMMKLTSVTLTLLFMSIVAHAAPTVFVAHGGGNVGAPYGGEIGRIDLTTGTYTTLTTLGSLTSLVYDGSYLYTFETQGGLILKIDPDTGAVLSSVPLSGVRALTDMAYDPTTGRFYGTGTWLFPNYGFYSLDIATGVASFISFMTPGAGGQARQIAFGPDGTLYMHATNTPGRFFTIDPLSGAITSEISGGVPGGVLGLAVNPISGELIASECCQGTLGELGERLFSIDPTTGTATLLFDFDDNRRMQDFAFQPLAEALLEQLAEEVTDTGPGNSFADKIALVQTYLEVPDEESACSILSDFLNQVRAQRDKKLTEEQADQFTADAERLQAAIGCD